MLLIIILLVLIFGFGYGGYRMGPGVGYYGGGGLSLILTIVLMNNHHWAVAPAIVAGILIAVAIGLLNSFIVVKLGVNSFIATLGMGSILAALQARDGSAAPRRRSPAGRPSAAP